jgi:AMMECR1 domain-containing protein
MQKHIQVEKAGYDEKCRKKHNTKIDTQYMVQIFNIET